MTALASESRTSGAPFLTAVWDHLAMINFPADLSEVAHLAPPGTRIDHHAGRTFLSVVGFGFGAVRVRGLAIPGHRHFPEINLRAYVVRDTPQGSERGVVFVREIVPRAMISLVARFCYGEPYVTRPMRSDVQAGHAVYSFRENGRWMGLRVAFRGTPALPEPGSETAFIAEHYWGFTARRDGRTATYRVEHPPWRVWSATEAALAPGTAEAYGARYAAVLSRATSSAFVAEGSPIAVSPGRVLDGTAHAR